MIVLLSACSSTRWPAALRAPATRRGGIERADGKVKVIETTGRSARYGGRLRAILPRPVVFSRDGRYLSCSRDGGLTQGRSVERRIVGRKVQAATRSAVPFRTTAAWWSQNYEPGGIKAFDANTLELGRRRACDHRGRHPPKVVGLADLSGKRFISLLFESRARSASPTSSNPKNLVTQRFRRRQAAL